MRKTFKRIPIVLIAILILEIIIGVSISYFCSPIKGIIFFILSIGSDALWIINNLKK